MSPPPSTPGSPPIGETGVERQWVRVSREVSAVDDDREVRPRRLLAQFAAGVLTVLTLVVALGAFAARQLAEREAVNDAATTAGVLAEGVVGSALTPEFVSGDPEALATFDAIVRERVLGRDIVRVKIWSPDGVVLYADEPQLIGRTFALSEDQRAALAEPATRAEISKLGESENAFEHADKLVEVYRPVWSGSGELFLFEMYASYDPVGVRTGQLWRGFAGVTASSLILLVVLVTPILLHLFKRLRSAEERRRELLQAAVDASETERRRLAATLHDGPVQELAATSFTVAGAAAQATARGEIALADDLSAAAASVRSSIRAMRTLLVDLYPQSLASSGLVAALHDLAQSVRREEVTILVSADDDETLALDDATQRQVYRIAQECLRDAVSHAGPATVTVSLHRQGRVVTLDVIDDGVGLDLSLLAEPARDHFGLRMLADAASTPGVALHVSSAHGAGTHWRLTLDTHQGGSA